MSFRKLITCAMALALVGTQTPVTAFAAEAEVEAVEVVEAAEESAAEEAPVSIEEEVTPLAGGVAEEVAEVTGTPEKETSVDEEIEVIEDVETSEEEAIDSVEDEEAEECEHVDVDEDGICDLCEKAVEKILLENEEECESSIHLEVRQMEIFVNDNHDLVEDYIPASDTTFIFDEEVPLAYATESVTDNEEIQNAIKAATPEKCPEDLDVVAYLDSDNNLASIDVAYTEKNELEDEEILIEKELDVEEIEELLVEEALTIEDEETPLAGGKDEESEDEDITDNASDMKNEEVVAVEESEDVTPVVDEAEVTEVIDEVPSESVESVDTASKSVSENTSAEAE